MITINTEQFDTFMLQGELAITLDKCPIYVDLEVLKAGDRLLKFNGKLYEVLGVERFISHLRRPTVEVGEPISFKVRLIRDEEH